MISPRRTGWIVAVLTVACVGLIIRHGHSGRAVSSHLAGHQHHTSSIGINTANPTSAELAATSQARDPEQTLQQGSLRDTVIDGQVSVGFAGHLKPDLALRRLFDYYLALHGETDLAGIRGLLQRDLLHRRLAGPLADEVMQTFDNYVRYQQAATNLSNQRGLDLNAQFAQLQSLRQQILGDSVAQAFYGTEEAQQAMQMQRLAIESRNDLSPAQKSQQLQSLDATMPAAQREARTEASVGQLVQQQTAQFDAANADAATRHAERAEIWGDTVADRLALLDHQRAQWQSRLDVYSTERVRIQQNAELDEASRQTALQKLLQTSFKGNEQLQVQAMARSGALTPIAR